MFKKILELKLKYFAKFILLKYKPEIIGITGSVGKTSAKSAIYTVLSKKHKVRQNIKNYNNELGLPLTIIGEEAKGRNILGWFSVFLKATKLLIRKDKNYPEILILEMGIDRPGDMKYLTSITKCNVGVVTLIGPSHLEYFESLEQIKEEKRILIERLKKDAYAVLNYDNEDARVIADATEEKVISYGFKEGAEVRASNLKFRFEDSKEAENLMGLSFDLSHDNKKVKIIMDSVIGFNSVYAALCGASVGIAYKISLSDIALSLKKYKAPRGRMNLIKGIKNSIIIDDTYNSSPQSTLSAIDIVKKIPIDKDSRSFAVLGDMLELGAYSEEGHKEVGEYVFKSGFDKLITVGEKARDICRGAKRVGMKRDDIFNFKNSEEAKKFIQDRIKEGDLLLIKGSQGVRMEKIVKEIMTNPQGAKYLLVRQEEEWLKKQ
jgi:UDP-N-acetylmuramoyl-tripeptide--D-alanyl-D-alanine ligase